MRKKILSNFVVLIISTILSLGAGEYICRAFDLSKTWESYIASRQLSQGVEAINNLDNTYTRTPHVSFIGPRNVSMNINSDGFRDEPFTTKGKKKRIAFIGDSVTEGFGVEIEDRYSDRFGSLFNNEIETLNFGIAGYTTIDELEILKKYIIPSQPDMVVLQVYFNDFARNLNRIAAKKEEPKETVVAAVAKQQQQKNQG